MPKPDPSPVKIEKFLGLNNKAEPRAMVPGELVEADNIDIDDRNAVRRRRDSRQVVSLLNITSCWATPDETRMFLVAAGVLYEVVGDGYGLIQLATGLSGDETHWTTDGERVFVSNPAGDLIIYRSEAYPLAVPEITTPVIRVISGNLPPGRYLVAVLLEDERGRQGGASQIVQVELATNGGLQFDVPAVPAGYSVKYYASRTNGDNLYHSGQQLRDIGALTTSLEEAQYNGRSPMPGGPIAWHAGRLYKGLDNLNDGTGVVVASDPFWPHLFHYGKDDFVVPGKVRCLADFDKKALLIGTSIRILARDLEGTLDTLADYGVIGGHTVAQDDDGTLYFWTEHGMCRALPFENLTEGRLSVPTGTRCAVGIVKHGGFERVVALTKVTEDEEADNAR